MFDIPLAEVVTDYFDQLKSRSKGYASMEYKVGGVELQNGVLGVGFGVCILGMVHQVGGVELWSGVQEAGFGWGGGGLMVE